MLPVLVFFFSFLFVNGLANLYTNRKQSTAFQTVACFLILVLFFACRDLPVLNDTAHYYGYMWKLINSNGFENRELLYYSDLDRFEAGFQIWSRFVNRYIWTDAYSMIFISALINSFALVYMARRYNKEKIALTIFFLIGWSYMMYSGMRQGYALVLFFIAIVQLEKKHYLWYYFWVLLAYTFHHSVAVTLLFPIVLMFKPTKKVLVVVALCTVAVAAMIYPLLDQAGFSDSIYYRVNINRLFPPIAATLNFLLDAFFVFIAWKLHKDYHTATLSRTMAWSWVVSLCFSAIAIPFLVLGRVAAYWSIFIYIGFVHQYIQAKKMQAVTEIKNTSQHVAQRRISPETWLVIAVVIYLAKLIVVITFKNEWNHLVPYSFYDFEPGLHNWHFGY